MFIFITAILDLRMFIAVSKYQINHSPMARSFHIFDTMFLNIHGTKCQKKEILLQLVQGCNIFQVRLTRLLLWEGIREERTYRRRYS